jgi:hypothetical protein
MLKLEGGRYTTGCTIPRSITQARFTRAMLKRANSVNSSCCAWYVRAQALGCTWRSGTRLVIVQKDCRSKVRHVPFLFDFAVLWRRLPVTIFTVEQKRWGRCRCMNLHLNRRQSLVHSLQWEVARLFVSSKSVHEVCDRYPEQSNSFLVTSSPL